MEQFHIDVKKGALACTIQETWQLVLSRPLTCGQKFKRTIKYKTGVVQEQREDLEATIKGSFGLKGLLQLESTLSARSGSTVKFEKSKEVAETIEVKAPPKGRHLLRYYQKKQLFHFVGSESRLFSNEPWFLTVERGLEQYRDDSRRYEIDPNCCSPKEFKPELLPDGVIELVMAGGKLTLSTPYRITDTGVQLTNLRLNTGSDISQLLDSKTRIPRDSLPPYLQYLGSEKEGDIEAVMLPYQPLINSGNAYMMASEFSQAFFAPQMFPGLSPGPMTPGFGTAFNTCRGDALPYATVQIDPMAVPMAMPELRMAWGNRGNLPMVKFESMDKAK